MKKMTYLLAALLFTLSLQARVVVVSDIDDTLKTANSVGKIGKLYHFLRKQIYPHSRDLFVELNHYYRSQNEAVDFYYVSAAPDAIFAQEKWLDKNGFPAGPTFLRHLGDPKAYDFKYKTIEKFLKKYQDDGEAITVYFFGDNADQDHNVYHDLTQNLKLDSHIFIRDVKAEASGFDGIPMRRVENIEYFFSERELSDSPTLAFLSPVWEASVQLDYVKQELIPNYTFATLKRTYRNIEGCKIYSFRCRSDAKERAEMAWEDYYSRY